MVVKYTLNPDWQAFTDKATARWVLPTPGGPRKITLPFCRMKVRKALHNSGNGRV